MAARYLPGEIEQLVLLAVLRLNGEGYAVPVRDLIVREGRVRVSRGTIYVTLDRLEQKGLLRSTFCDPQPVRGGKSRRLFHITRSGMDALRHARGAVERLAAGTRLASEGIE
jgi:PadR family transcriptional regulator, regulatory protein PadR